MRKFVYWIKKAFNRNSSSIDYHKMYEHDIKKLMNYGSSLSITLDIPNDIEKNAMTITAWEASGRYDDLFSKGYR